MFKTFKDFEIKLNNNYLIKEDLLSLKNNLENKKGYELEFKNLNALNSQNDLNLLIVKVINGNAQKLIETITNLYNFTASLNVKNNIITFKKI